MVEACPSEDELLELLDGHCARARAAALEMHIAACDECRELVAQLVRIAEQEQQSIDTRVVTAIAARSPHGATVREAGAGELRGEPPAAQLRSGPAPRDGEWVFNETYVVKRVLGAGGMGCVYEAAHRRLERRFAIKVLAGAVALDPKHIARFRSEAEITSRLEHPNIVEVVDFDYHEEGFPYLVMELLEGEPLGARISRGKGPMALDDVDRILAQIAGALDAAHAAGVVHRDLTPQNIFLCERDGRDDFVKVLDFGVSKLTEAPALTQTRTVLGTPHFMSPEQADGRGADADWRSDIFSMGTMLYQMLTRRVPFSGRSVPSVLYAIVHHEPDPPSRWRPELPLPIERVVLRALSKERERRPASMGELARAFSAALRSRDVVELLGDDATGEHESAERTDSVTPAAPLPVGAARSRGGQRWRQAATIAVAVAAGALISALALRGGSSGGGKTSGAAQTATTATNNAATDNAATPGSAATDSAATNNAATDNAATPGSAATDRAATNDAAISANAATPRSAATNDAAISTNAATPSSAATADAAAAASPSHDAAPVRIVARATPSAPTKAPRRARTRRSRSNRTSRRRSNRARASGVLHVQTRGPDRKPLWANVYLDGKLVGQTALTLEHVPAGRHVLLIKRRGYRSMRRRIRVRPGARVSVALRLRER